MNTETQIIIGGITGTITLAPDAEQIKKAALDAAALIRQVKTAEELEAAVTARRGLNDIDKGVEKSREEHKAPILKVGRELDAMAKAFVAPVVKERDRLDGMVNWYQRDQLRLAEEARQEAERKQRAAEKAAADAQAEIARLEREKAEAKAREEAAAAEAKRQLEEAAKMQAGKAQEAALEAARAAEQQATAARAQQEQAEEASLRAELSAETVDLSPAVLAAPVQLKGVTTKSRKTYKVQGCNQYEEKASLLKLAAKYPHLVSVEIRHSDTLNAINNQGITELPGIDIHDEISTRIR